MKSAPRGNKGLKEQSNHSLTSFTFSGDVCSFSLTCVISLTGQRDLGLKRKGRNYVIGIFIRLLMCELF